MSRNYTVSLCAFALITGRIDVEAESCDDAMQQAVARCDQATWPIDQTGASIEVAPGFAFAHYVGGPERGEERWPTFGAGLSQANAAIIGNGLLANARDLFKVAGAARTLERVRLAITSAGGAIRNARSKAVRAEIADARAEG